MNINLLRRLAVAALLLASSAPTQASVISASGTTAADIQNAVDNFRAALGVNNGVGGTFASGRREINWDGVPAAASDPNALPANFFNSNSPRGVNFSTPGTGFLVSPGFTSQNAGYAGEFSVFSAAKLFSPVGSNITDITFFIPGTATQTYITAFGAVFSDVEIAASAKLQFFDENDVSLGQFGVPVSGDGGLSFLGLTWGEFGTKVGRVRIFSGNVNLGTLDGIGQDISVLDDFIYDEPFNPALHSSAQVPEPATVMLTAVGAGLLCLLRRRR